MTSASSQIGSSSMTGTVETFATWALASQSSARQGCSNSSTPDGSSDDAKLHASAFGKGAVGVDPHGGAAVDGALDRVHAYEVIGRVLADLDLEGAKALLEPPLDLGPDLVRRRAVERREQRQANLAIDLQQRMILKHLDRGQQRRRRHLAGADVGGNDRLGLARYPCRSRPRRARGKTPSRLRGSRCSIPARCGLRPSRSRPSLSRTCTMIGSNSVKVRYDST